FVALGYAWDTTTEDDGEHTVSATDGTFTAEAAVVVDNTAPVITPELTADTATEGRLQGRIVLDGAVSDAITEVADVVATLDGERVTLPHETSSLDLAP